MIRVTKEEGHYTIKRVDALPKKGNANWLYMLKSDPVEKFYRWQIEGEYEEINIGTVGIGSQDLQEVTDIGNITTTLIKPQGGIRIDDITTMPEVVNRVMTDNKYFSPQEQTIGFFQNGSNITGDSGVPQNSGTEFSTGDWSQWRDSQTYRYPYSLMLLRGGTLGTYRVALTSLLKEEGASQISSRLQVGYSNLFPDKTNQFTLSVNGTGEFLDNITSIPLPTVDEHLANKGYVDIKSLQKIKISLTASDIKNLMTTNFPLINAPGAGKLIVLHSFITSFNWETVAFDELTTFIEWSGGATYGTGDITTSGITDKLERIAVDAPANMKINEGISFASDADSIATGDSTLDIYITYETITL